MAEVGQRLLLVPGSWGRIVCREVAGHLNEVPPRQRGREAWHVDSSVKLKEDEVGVEHGGTKLKQKQGSVGQVYTSLREKTGPSLGQEAERAGQKRLSSLGLDVGSYQDSRVHQRPQGGSLGQRGEAENHPEETVLNPWVGLEEGVRSIFGPWIPIHQRPQGDSLGQRGEAENHQEETVLNPWVGLEEEVRSIFGPCNHIHQDLYTCPIPDNINPLSSWPNPLQAGACGDLTQIGLVKQETPHGTMINTLRKCSMMPLLGQQSFSNLTALICGASQQKLFSRAYSTSNGTRRNTDSLKAPLFRSRTAYYDILGVTGTATQAQIKTAYYRQSFRYHPDRNSGNEDAADRFNEISEAYLILGSVGLRKKYDRGILSQEDVRAAGKPSSNQEGPVAAVPKRRQTSSSSRYMPGKPVFDFDEFYRAHYGEQLEREKFMKWKREELRRKRVDMNEKWQLSKLTEVVALVFISSAFFLVFGLK